MPTRLEEGRRDMQTRLKEAPISIRWRRYWPALPLALWGTPLPLPLALQGSLATARRALRLVRRAQRARLLAVPHSLRAVPHSLRALPPGHTAFAVSGIARVRDCQRRDIQLRSQHRGQQRGACTT